MSVAWYKAATNMPLIDQIITQQEVSFFDNMTSESSICNSHSGLIDWDLEKNLCAKFKQDHFDLDENRQHKVHPPHIYSEAFMNGAMHVPKTTRKAKIAVFNFGLHILGGYVDPSRWEKGSLQSFVSQLNTTYPEALRNTVATLRAMGFRYVVFKGTNTLDEHKFFGAWKKVS